MKFFRDLNFCTRQGLNLDILGEKHFSIPRKISTCDQNNILNICPWAKVTPALSLSLGRHPLGAPQRQMWKSLRQDFPSKIFFQQISSRCFFVYLRDIQGVLRADNICCWGSDGKCICIESTGAPLGFIENNCGNHSSEKKLGIFLKKGKKSISGVNKWTQQWLWWPAFNDYSVQFSNWADLESRMQVPGFKNFTFPTMPPKTDGFLISRIYFIAFSIHINSLCS